MGRWLPHVVIAMLMTVLKASNGGAGAKYDFPGGSVAPSCLATSRDLQLGSCPSPLLTSTHRTDMGAFPVLSNDRWRGTFTHTPLLQKNSNSLARADLTRSSRGGYPVKSSL